jgi:hypothetical protein
MAVVYTKKDQGNAITTGTGAPVHSAVAGDRYTDTVNGDTYQYTTSWTKVSYGYIRRHEATAGYDYLGYAAQGTNESATSWTLTRLTLDSSGISAVMRATDSWTNRVTATYS